tara:strand:- start:6821 stop:7453 length:633 start_codon:yes stop_codon:yes gene_type:complete
LAKETLHSHEGREALKYLTEERGISIDVLKNFDVGYCPARVDHELKNRIITPIYDVYCNLVALSSRHLKYKSFFHESYDKSFYLYGLHAAKRDIICYNKAIVVEGEFDALYLHSHGFPIAVSMNGSSFGFFQTSLLSRYCSNIYVIFDADKKREQSVKRTREMYKRMGFGGYGINFFLVYLPNGCDPDDYLKENGKEAFIHLLQNSVKVK